MTITEFLLARIAEDETVATAAQERTKREPWWVDGPAQVSGKFWVYATGEKFDEPMVADHIARHGPARVLAECEAKRRIIETLVLPYIAERRRLMNGQPSWGDEHPDLLLLLALPYADHPDFREEWKL